MISAVVSVLSVAVRVGVLRLGGVGSSGPHSVQVELLVVGVEGLSVRLPLVKVVVAVRRLPAVVAHVRHRRLGQRRRVLGVWVAAHRSGVVRQNPRDLLLVDLPGAHGASSCPQFTEKVPS